MRMKGLVFLGGGGVSSQWLEKCARARAHTHTHTHTPTHTHLIVSLQNAIFGGHLEGGA